MRLGVSAVANAPKEPDRAAAEREERFAVARPRPKRQRKRGREAGGGHRERRGDERAGREDAGDGGHVSERRDDHQRDAVDGETPARQVDLAAQPIKRVMAEGCRAGLQARRGEREPKRDKRRGEKPGRRRAELRRLRQAAEQKVPVDRANVGRRERRAGRVSLRAAQARCASDGPRTE